MRDNNWVRLLAYVTGLVNQRLLLQNEYLVAENRILRSPLPSRLRFPIRSAPLWLRSAKGLAARDYSRSPPSRSRTP